MNKETILKHARVWFNAGVRRNVIYLHSNNRYTNLPFGLDEQPVVNKDDLVEITTK